MRFACRQCHTKYQIDDARVAGKVLKIRCKTCHELITVTDPALEDGGAHVAAVHVSATTAEHAVIASPPGEPGSGEIGATEHTQPAVAPVASRADLAARRAAAAAPASGVPAKPLARVGPRVRSGATPIAGSVERSTTRPIARLIDWYVSFDGVQEGPYALPRAQQRIRDELKHDKEIYCWRDGFAAWLPLDSVSEMAPALRPAPPPLPPPPVAARRAVSAAAKAAGAHPGSAAPKPSASTARAATPGGHPVAMPGPTAGTHPPETAHAAPVAHPDHPDRLAGAEAPTLAATARERDEEETPPAATVYGGNEAEANTLAAMAYERDDRDERTIAAPVHEREESSASATDAPHAATGMAVAVNAVAAPGGDAVRGGEAAPSAVASPVCAEAEPVAAGRADRAATVTIAGPGSARTADLPARAHVAGDGAAAIEPEPAPVPSLPFGADAVSSSSHGPAQHGGHIGHDGVAASRAVTALPTPALAAQAGGRTWAIWALGACAILIAALGGMLVYTTLHRSAAAEADEPRSSSPAQAVRAAPPVVDERPVGMFERPSMAAAPRLGLAAAGTSGAVTAARPAAHPVPAHLVAKRAPAPSPGTTPILSSEQKNLAALYGSQPEHADVTRISSPTRSERSQEQVSDAQIMAAVTRNKKSVQLCYERSLKHDESLRNLRVDVEVRIGISGSVTGVNFVDQTLAATDLGRCLGQSIRGWRFPSQDSEYETAFPLLLQAQ